MPNDETDFKTAISKLKDIRYQFFIHSSDDARQKIEALDLAIEALTPVAKEQAKAARLNKEMVDLIGGGQKSAPKHSFIFLIDGSASMTITHCGSNSTVLKTALTSFASLQMAAPLMESTVINGGLWGTNHGIAWLMGDLNDPQVYQRVKNGLNSATDLAPALDNLQSIVGQTSSRKTRQHIVIVSDGDISDKEKAETKLTELLSANSDVTLDFIIYTFVGAGLIEDLANSLKTAFPQQVGLKRIQQMEKTPATAFTEVVRGHLYAPKAKKPPGPRHKG